MLTEKCTFLVGPEAHAVFFSASDEELDQAPVYSFMTPIFGRGVVYDCPLEERRQQMRHLGHSLRPEELRRYAEIIAREAHAYFDEVWRDEGTVDLLPSIADLIIRTASATLMGDDVRAHMMEEMADLYHTLDKGLTPLSVFFPHAPTAAHRARDRARKQIGQLFGRIISARRGSAAAAAGRHDLIQKLMEFRYKDGKALTDDEIAGMMIATLFAGQHTSTITLTWTLIFLLDGERTLQRQELSAQPVAADSAAAAAHMRAVVAEIDALQDAASAEKAAFSEGVGVTHTILAQQKHLYACIKESIRLHPPLIFLMRRVMTELTTAGGVTIPVGHRVMVSNAVAMRLPDVFASAGEWRPERWLGGKDADGALKRYSFIGFGAGQHTCMGESFAFMQIRAILTVMISKFELVLETPVPTPDLEAMVVMPHGPNIVRYRRRAGAAHAPPPRTLTSAEERTADGAAAKASVGAGDCKAALREYTEEEVALHCAEHDCWLHDGEHVYDVTKYLPLHQGGTAAILRWAGRDASAPVAGPQHPADVGTLLQRYCIGKLRR